MTFSKERRLEFIDTLLRTLFDRVGLDTIYGHQLFSPSDADSSTFRPQP
jgi:hypothetical protein